MKLEVAFLQTARAPRGAWAAADLKALAAFVWQAEKVKGDWMLTLLFTTHAQIRGLNRRYRGVDRTTDVISFRDEGQGDIAINVAQAALQARRMKHSLAREIRLLWIHGLLHLQGYTDYEPIPRRRMFKRQNELLRRWERRKDKK